MGITFISIILLLFISYQDSQFKNNPLSIQTLTLLKQKEYHIRKLILQKYNLNVKIPIIISKELRNNLFGLTTYNQQTNKIQIFLNKKRFQETKQYMIDSVLPHEYAHALMFVLKNYNTINKGHSKQWQEICLNLEGQKCDRFVKDNDIIMDKLNLFTK